VAGNLESGSQAGQIKIYILKVVPKLLQGTCGDGEMKRIKLGFDVTTK